MRRWCCSDKRRIHNQALNTFTTTAPGLRTCSAYAREHTSPSRSRRSAQSHVRSHPSADSARARTISIITDPPYGDAVKYEEILEFFIAWLRKNPPPEFADWVWDSRRSLAIKGEDEDFRRGMVAAYKRMTECMPDNGIQVIMFTHQSGTIWADMANIVWASGLQVTAAWYVVTETDSALREGSYVKGTVLLVLPQAPGHAQDHPRRPGLGDPGGGREHRSQTLTGLNQEAKGLYRDENVFEDADIQMAGYAAALRVLTRYAVIDGRDMTAEAIRPRVKGETTFVDGLIAFAVDTANQCLVPQGIAKSALGQAHAARSASTSRCSTSKPGAPRRWTTTRTSPRRSRSATSSRSWPARRPTTRGSRAPWSSASRDERRFGAVPVRAARRALRRHGTGEERGRRRGAGPPDAQRARLLLRTRPSASCVVELADYLAKKLETLRPEEASAARVLRELVKNQRLG